MAETVGEDKPTLPKKRKLTEEHEHQNPSLKTQKLTTSSSSKDRISDLPDAVMQHILSFGTLRDAIKVCTLSRQWKSLWTNIPELSFRCKRRQNVDRFASFVDEALSLYSAPKVKTFSLEFPYDFEFEDQLDSWLCFAGSHNVENLYVQFKGPDMFAFNVLRGCVWMSLKVLSLVQLMLRTDMIGPIFRGSPLMTSLTLRRCLFLETVGSNYMIDAANASLKTLVLDSCYCEIDYLHSIQHNVVSKGRIEIKGPNLQSLSVVGDMGSTSLKLIEVSSLVEANIDFWVEWCSASEKKNIKGILEKLLHVDRLTVGAWVLQVLSIMRLNGEIFSTSRCKSLNITMRLHERYLPGMEGLFQCSPYLEQLIINLSPRAPDVPTLCRKKHYVEEKYWRSEARIFRCLNQTLKRVEIIGSLAGHPRWNWNQILVETVQFLLDNAKVLQKLTVHAQADNQNRLLEIKEIILHYPRSSPDASIEFKS